MKWDLESPTRIHGGIRNPTLRITSQRDDLCVWESISVWKKMWGGLRGTPRPHAQWIFYRSSRSCMMRHGFRDSGARPASSSPPAFYYYRVNITQAALIIHHHLSARSHAEETRHPAARTEISLTSVRGALSCLCWTNYELWWTGYTRTELFKNMPSVISRASALQEAPCCYFLTGSHPCMKSTTLWKKCHWFQAVMNNTGKAKWQQLVRESVWRSRAMPEQTRVEAVRIPSCL